ncbi:unnamed protein product [Aphanomyces euteiches]|uniref:protein-histidine N-methyltransferase n=1 Tax=Aphanomyces euteiches TaxID=100861 RepID=A0A6G0X3U9_9STRA|nr:hypothetical protein Ae201684_008772 [Aphanomyces euteiches]KAH9085467.1 hypothetical protein Ae201684P_005175 [Aphanomyces euteiches]KAH9146052.1 hypothetical protein AeRB84_010055 [Aphanomyces euteiches]
MFRFNFGDAAEDDNPSQGQATGKNDTPKRLALKHETPLLSFSPDQFVQVPIGAHTMAIVNQLHPRFLEKTGALATLLTTSDIQTGVYEGGFKLWEGAVDLIQFMIANTNEPPIRGCRVMELGCGHGLPGIYALHQGAREVVFSDYNSEVIELATIPNVLRNAPHAKPHATFISGDWGLMADLLPGGSADFDLILTAETLYTESVTVDLFHTIQRYLKKRGGVALVAAKTYYFGTGGSVHHFKQLIARDGSMSAQTVWESSDGRSTVREIVRVEYKSDTL